MVTAADPVLNLHEPAGVWAVHRVVLHERVMGGQHCLQPDLAGSPGVVDHPLYGVGGSHHGAGVVAGLEPDHGPGVVIAVGVDVLDFGGGDRLAAEQEPANGGHPRTG